MVDIIIIILATSPRPEIIDPCRPSPCGTNAVCNERNQAASCSCLPGLQGNPYIECKPECTINQECPTNLACMQQKCRDPCPGVCGVHATCSVNNHYPICRCEPGYTGDAFSSCVRKTTRMYLCNSAVALKKVIIHPSNIRYWKAIKAIVFSVGVFVPLLLTLIGQIMPPPLFFWLKTH